MALNDRSRRRARSKTRNKAQELKGQIKEATGRATDNPRLEAKGRAGHVRLGRWLMSRRDGWPVPGALSQLHVQPQHRHAGVGPDPDRPIPMLRGPGADQWVRVPSGRGRY
jgi:hypothetical protein